MHPDECSHGNTHIEGVNECVICQRDSLAVALKEAEQQRDKAQAAAIDVDGWRASVDEAYVQYERVQAERDAAIRERDEAQKELNELLDALVLGPLEAGTMQDTIIVLRQGIDAAIAHVKELERACPCTHVTPCHDRCACVMPLSSSACRRCCKYGSKDQQRSAASRIAGALAVYEAAIAWEADKGTESSWNRPNGSDERLRQAVRTVHGDDR